MSNKSAHPFDLKEVRDRIERKDKSIHPKIISLRDAVERFIPSGSHVAVGGCLYSRTPTAVIHEIIRQKRGDLTVSRSLTGMEADLLLVASALSKVVTSWWSIGYAWGISAMMRKFVQEGKVEFEEWSHLALGLRYRAAAMGTSFLPTFSMLGTDLERTNKVEKIICPYTKEKMLLVPALYPDVGLIHAQRADKFGNVDIDGFHFMDEDIARASRHVIVTAEEIVDSEHFRNEPDRTVIPFFCVDAVVEVPYGAYPSECWNRYDADFSHFSAFSQATNEKGTDGANEYLSKYVYGSESFQNFLNMIGPGRLLELRKSMENVIR
jgi:glutaconate CoA-transferase subunit A